MASLHYHEEHKTWKLRWYEGNKLRSKTLGKVTKKQAHDAKKRKEWELMNSDVIASQVTVSEFVSQRFLDYYEPTVTADTFKRAQGILNNQILPTFGGDMLAKIDVEKVELWKRGRQKDGAASQTINKELNLLRNLIHRGEEWGLVAKNPIKHVKDVKNTRSKPFNFYTAEQLQALYDASGDYQSLWKLLANTGMRRGEAHQLKWSDVHADSIHVISTDEERTKSAKWRDIPISPGCKAALEELRKADNDGYVMPRVAKQTISRAFSRDAKRAGLEGSMHDLRHTFISHLVMQRVPLRTVQELAGHSSIRVTEQYAHLAPEHKQEAVKGLTL